MNKADFKIFNAIIDSVLESENTNPVVVPVNSELLDTRFDLKLEESGVDDMSLESVLREIVLNTPKTSTNRFFNQLFGGRNSKATLGELISVFLNNSMYTYKVGGPMIGIEKELILGLCNLAGYSSDAYGTMAPGGSMANFMAMLMARDNISPSVRTFGYSQKMIIYTSEECHYSIKKNASFMGIGHSQIRFIESDGFGAMDTDALELSIKKDLYMGNQPFLVIGTAGTTVMGAIDPIAKIADIAKKYKLWYHLDGAFYGSLLFSEKYKKLLAGIELTDSVSINTHKLFSTPLSCSFILTKHKKSLYDSFNSTADYLFQSDGDDLNPGKISLQCGRRNDALKMWVLWKSLGSKKLGAIIDHEFDLADYAREYIRKNKNYTLYSFDNSLSVCFNYKAVPAQKLCALLNENGELMVGYGAFKDQTFVRFVLVNSQNQKEDILNFFKRLEEFSDKHFLS